VVVAWGLHGGPPSLSRALSGGPEVCPEGQGTGAQAPRQSPILGGVALVKRSTTAEMTTRSASRGTWTPERLLDDLERLALGAPTRVEFFDEAAARLKRTVPFDAACWHTLDPGSDLITEHRLQGLPDRFPILANNEYAVEDVNKFADLAHAPLKAATLHRATDGHLDRSPRFRDLLSHAGVGAELRSAF